MMCTVTTKASLKCYGLNLFGLIITTEKQIKEGLIITVDKVELETEQ